MRPPKSPPPQAKWLEALAAAPRALAETTATLPDGRYLHWDELRHRTPPEHIPNVELWWGVTRLARRGAANPVPQMSAVLPQAFSYVETPIVREALHRFDRQNVSEVLAAALGNEDAVTEYRVRALIEEAISSSEIEGARPTTRDVARKMVREGRPPATKDERMIANNWRAMRRILELREEERPLQLDDLLELHRILDDDALDVPDGAGELRGSEHDVHIADHEGVVWHVPPPAVDPSGRLPPIRERVQAMLDFANAEPGDRATFIHPVVRAIITHFWVGYEHPFRDGNGRIARALFYWVMLSNGYEMAEFISISGPIDRKPSAYYRAFAYVETDDGDLTYFILHQLRVLDDALKELLDHLERRARQVNELASVIADFELLNRRQRALMQESVRDPLTSYTIEGHASTHRVHYLTARSDLKRLVELGYLREERVGKSKRFYPSERLAQLVKDRREGSSEPR